MFRAVHRKLELAFVFNNRPFAWRCSICERLFAASNLDVGTEELAEIDRNFRIHLCYPLLDVEEITELDRPVPSSLRLHKER